MQAVPCDDGIHGEVTTTIKLITQLSPHTVTEPGGRALGVCSLSKSQAHRRVVSIYIEA